MLQTCEWHRVIVARRGGLADNPAMMESTKTIWEWPAAVIMERTALVNRWVDAKWEVHGIVRDTADGEAKARAIRQTAQRTQTLHPGFVLRLHRDEAEGYYYNLTSPHPRVFVLWRMEDDVARPKFLSVSYHEGSRWLDSGDPVDGVPLPAELQPWMAEFVALHYRPEEKKPRKYASNKDKGRMGNSG